MGPTHIRCNLSQRWECMLLRTSIHDQNSRDMLLYLHALYPLELAARVFFVP